ncbi:MAG: ROK family protein [Phycisphaerales bacterium]
MPTQKKPIAGVDLGGTNIQIGIAAPGDFRLLGRAKRKTKPEDGQAAVIQRILDGIAEACEEAKLKAADLAAVGIGAPGVIAPDAGTVVEAVNLRWNNVPLAQLVTKKTGIPTVVDNDVNAAVYGENRLGAGENAPDLLGVWIGTGIGGGLILGGRLYYGTFLSAGEIGHTILYPGMPLGERTVENFCSRTSVVERITRLIRQNHTSAISRLVDDDLSQVRSKTLAKAFEMNDELTHRVINETAELLGQAIASTVTLLSLGRVVLGGGLTEAIGEPLVDRVKRVVRAHVFPEKARAVKVVGTKLRDDAGVLGAALLASERL